MDDRGMRALSALHRVVEHSAADETLRAREELVALREEFENYKRAWVPPVYLNFKPGGFFIFQKWNLTTDECLELDHLLDGPMRYAFESLAPEQFATPLEHFEVAGETFESDYFRIRYLRARKHEFIKDHIETTYHFQYGCFALRFLRYKQCDGKMCMVLQLPFKFEDGREMTIQMVPYEIVATFGC